MNSDGLKPCPFCGSEEVIFIPLGDSFGYLYCTGCDMATNKFWNDMTADANALDWKQKARNAWNRRCEK